MKTIMEAFLTLFIPSLIYFVVKENPFVLDNLYVVSTMTGWLFIAIFVLPFYFLCKLLIHFRLNKAAIFVSIINCIVIAHLFYRYSLNDFVSVHFENDHNQILVLTFSITALIVSLIFIYASLFIKRKIHNSSTQLHNVK